MPCSEWSSKLTYCFKECGESFVYWESFSVLTEGGENSFLPSEIGVRNCSSEGRSVSAEDAELSACGQGWVVSESLCSDGLRTAVGTGRNVNLALSSSAGALLVTGSLLWAPRVYYREHRSMARYRNICHGRAVNWGFLFNKQYFNRTASFYNINLYNWILKHSGLTESYI